MTETNSVKDLVCNFDNLYKAMLKCKRGVMWKDSVASFVNNPLVKIVDLKNALYDGSYTISSYYTFIIYEPKVRVIISTRFKDRVFQRSLCDNYLYKQLTKSFAYDNGACQVGKGTDFSRERLKAHLQKFYRKHGTNGYILKCDVKNYFGSTPHSVAKEVLAEKIKDKWALERVFELIDSYDTGEAIGLGLGSQITQLIQLAFLDSVDTLIKEKLKIDYYDRYMDDIILIHQDKEYLRYCLSEIEKEFEKKGIKTNKNKTQIFKITESVEFLGFKYRVTETGKVLMILNKKSVLKRKRKIIKYHELMLNDKMTLEKLYQTIESFEAHSLKGNNYRIIKDIRMYVGETINGKNTNRKRTITKRAN